MLTYCTLDQKGINGEIFVIKTLSFTRIIFELVSRRSPSTVGQCGHHKNRVHSVPYVRKHVEVALQAALGVYDSFRTFIYFTAVLAKNDNL